MPDRDFVRRNLEKLIKVRGASSYQLSLDMKRARTFIHDFLTGRKQKLGGDSLLEITRRLDADLVTYFYNDNEIPDDPSKIVPFAQASIDRLVPIALAEDEAEVMQQLEKLASGALHPEPNTDLSKAQDLPNFRGFSGPRDVPVRGTALGGSSDDGDFRFTSDVNLGHEPRPPGIMGRKGIYVVYVQNDSMDPKFEPGDRLYVDPHRPARPMDYVVIELHGHDGESGRGYIKRLVRKTPTRVILKQFNPRKEIEFDADQVKAIHRVIPQDELLGV